MLELFKGRISLTEIMWDIPYKILCLLKDERVRMLAEEEKELNKLNEEKSREEARSMIMAP